MALSPLSPAAVNAKSPSSFTSFGLKSPPHPTTEANKIEMIETSAMGVEEDEAPWIEDTSSPFQSHVRTEGSVRSISQTVLSTTEEASVSKVRSSSPSDMSSAINPLSTPFEICEDDTASKMPPPPNPTLTTSALARAMKRKSMSPVKSVRQTQFSVSSPNKQLATEERMSLKNTSRRSLQHFNAADISTPKFQRSDSFTRNHVFAGANALTTSTSSSDIQSSTAFEVHTAIVEADEGMIDDTCFSTFSEVPNMDMTKFASLGKRSPTKMLDQAEQPIYQQATPSTVRSRQHSRSPSPTPRANMKSDSDTTTLLLDFTQQFEAISTLSHKLRAASRRSMSPSKPDVTTSLAEPHLRSYLNNQRSPRKSVAQGVSSTPSSKNLLTLLDFELPPAPSPRSAPTISVRELESLKSNYASQISALKATLSGREAEVESLKRAVGDAERRVGEAAEDLREEKSRRECAEREKEEWVARGTEFEDVLRRVKKEVLEGEKEREEVLGRAEEAEERVRELEAQLLKAEERALNAESLKSDLNTSAGSSVEGESKGPLFTAEQVQKQIDEKVHILSTELHAIYKKKHVTKVAGLKKGFEAKTKEKTEELAAQIEKLERQNEDLQAKLDGTLSGVVPGLLTNDGVSSEQREAEIKQLEEQKVIIERQKAELAGREEELKTQRAEFTTVMAELEQERIEKGELVAAVDEMLALQSDMSVVHAAASEPSTAPLVEDVLRKSVGLGSRPSGLAKPGFGFGGASRLAKPTASKSRMMSQIEKMGGGRLAE